MLIRQLINEVYRSKEEWMVAIRKGKFSYFYSSYWLEDQSPTAQYVRFRLSAESATSCSGLRSLHLISFGETFTAEPGYTAIVPQ
jgi:hypothetical protein